METTEISIDLTGWAHRKFGLLPPATPDQARRAWTQRLSTEDFFPSVPMHAAWMVLSRQPLAPAGVLHEEAVLDREDGLREELEGFAKSFFQQTPAERRRQLDALRQRCGNHPPLQARLDWLEGGVEIQLDRFPANTNLAHLAQTLGELFTLPMADCAEKRRRLIADPPTGYADAARIFAKSHPDLVQLESDLIDGLKRGRVNVAVPAPRPARNFLPTRSGPAPVETTSGPNLIWVWFLVACAIIRVILSMTKG